ncbi:MAG TPA: GNAT family N-acetyltransferase [Polyangiaceae bacterium]|nr:GNAT family N-acetyltransferase [Polyangiaceae bacterium]
MRIQAATVDDSEAIERLLDRVYVAAGFTDPEVAKEIFRGEAVLARGNVLVAREDQVLAGMVVVVAHDSPARRMAESGDVEMHLLAVAPEFRRVGLGGELVVASLDFARARGAGRMVLWTQPLMSAAHRLYERHGFERSPTRDFNSQGREFLVFERRL